MTSNISLCIVVRNAAAELSLTLTSIDRQLEWLSLLPTEVVIIEGHSTDESYIIANNWAESCGLPARVICQEPRGIYPAMNEAWAKARGDWLLFINAGDVLVNAAALISALEKAEERSLGSIQFQSAVFMPGTSHCFWLPDVYPKCHQSLVYKRRLHLRCGAYDERLSICSDRLFDEQIRSEGRLLQPNLLSATQVSPANASRNPYRLYKDLGLIRRLGLPFELSSPLWITLLVLHSEKLIGCSFSVWLRIWLLAIRGKARRVSLN